MSAASSAAKQVALVTGANKGIGYFAVRQLAQARPQWTVLLGARDPAKGEEAAKKLALPNVKPIRVDVDDKASLQAAAEQIRKEYGEQPLVLLLNNAGIAWKGDAFDTEVVDGTFKTNYYGTLDSISTFLPLIPSRGRIVNTSSQSSISALRKMSAENRARFLDDKLDMDKLTALLVEFREAVAKGDWEAKGFPKTAYGMSKVGTTLLTRILARTSPRDITINAVCPGWCRTDMAGDKAPRTAEQGADSILHPCLLDDSDRTTGEFYDEHKKTVDLAKIGSE